MKTVLVTGGTKGIGKAIALEFLKQGCEVVLNYNSDERSALSTQEEFNMLGYCPVLMRADVSDEGQVRAMFKEFFSIYDNYSFGLEQDFCGKHNKRISVFKSGSRQNDMQRRRLYNKY